MDWARIQADWQHYSGLAHLRWGRISRADLDLIAGRRELLAAHIQQIYGISPNAAQMQPGSAAGKAAERQASDKQ